MILDPEGIISLLAEERKTSLAVLALLATCTGENPDTAWATAADRLDEAARIIAEQRDAEIGTTPTGRKKAHRTRRYEELDRVVKLAARLSGPLRQVAAVQAKTAGPRPPRTTERAAQNLLKDVPALLDDVWLDA